MHVLLGISVPQLEWNYKVQRTFEFCLIDLNFVIVFCVKLLYVSFAARKNLSSVPSQKQLIDSLWTINKCSFYGAAAYFTLDGST